MSYIILGAKRSKGTLDNGRAYDSTKIYVQTQMKSSDDQAGYAASEFTWGDSSNFEKIKNAPFPVKANIDFEMVTNGKSNQIVIVDVALATK